MPIIFEMAIKKFVKFFRLFILRKCSRNLVLRDWPVCPTYCTPQLTSDQVITSIRSDEVQSISLILIMENCLPFTDDVMVVLVHKCLQQTHLLALHFETLGYILRLLNALNDLVYFLIIGDPRGDNLMVGSISPKLLTELGIRTENADFVMFVLIIKVVWVSTIPRQAINTSVSLRLYDSSDVKL